MFNQNWKIIRPIMKIVFVVGGVVGASVGVASTLTVQGVVGAIKRRVKRKEKPAESAGEITIEVGGDAGDWNDKTDPGDAEENVGNNVIPMPVEPDPE